MTSDPVDLPCPAPSGAVGNTKKGVAPSIQIIHQGVGAVFRLDCGLAAIATVTFVPAVLFPLFTFQPRLFDPLFEGVVGYVQPGEFDPKSPSVLGGISLLFADGMTEGQPGDVIVAFVLAIFSVFFPAIKLALLWGVVVRPDVAKMRLVRRLESLGPWSMADVFVISVGLVAFKSFPGGTTFTVEAGYYLFLVSVISALLATRLTKARLERLSEAATGGREHLPT